MYVFKLLKLAYNSQTFYPASLSCESATSSAERTALLGAASQRSLLLSSDLRDEDTLL